MSYRVIYHGSEVVVEKPKYHYDGSNKFNDCGLGFYCTTNLDMAKELANRYKRSGFANKYEIDETYIISDERNNLSGKKANLNNNIKKIFHHNSKKGFKDNFIFICFSNYNKIARIIILRKMICIVLCQM